MNLLSPLVVSFPSVSLLSRKSLVSQQLIELDHRYPVCCGCLISSYYWILAFFQKWCWWYPQKHDKTLVCSRQDPWGLCWSVRGLSGRQPLTRVRVMCLVCHPQPITEHRKQGIINTRSGSSNARNSIEAPVKHKWSQAECLAGKLSFQNPSEFGVSLHVLASTEWKNGEEEQCRFDLFSVGLVSTSGKPNKVVLAFVELLQCQVHPRSLF